VCPEQMVLLETDPSRARSAARAALAPYLQLENYINNWRRSGFGDADLAAGGSDRFVDAMVAWGDETAIRAAQGRLDEILRPVRRRRALNPPEPHP